MNKNIQVLKPHYRVDECLEAIKECLDLGWTGLGFKTIEFEQAWCKYTGLPYSHFLNSATAGLHLAVKMLKDAYGWQDGDEIITTPLTFISTNHAIMYERLKPVFADVDSDTLCLCPKSVESKITPNTRAVMYVGLGGRYGHLDEIAALCKKRGLKLILDAAHMAGTRRWQNHAGCCADVSVFSFQAVKNLPTADSGMVCFKDTELDARVRKMSWLGIDRDTYARSNSAGAYKWKYDIPYVGYKYHGNSIMAAIGLVSLKYLEEDNKYRRKIAAMYDDVLKHNSMIWTPSDVIGAQSSSHIYQIIVEDRDQVLVELNKRDIYPGVHYVDNTHYPMYRTDDDSTFSRIVSDRLLTLPVHLDMTEEDVTRVAQAVNEIVL